jgi:hypothetical protein
MLQNGNAWMAVVLINYLFSRDNDKKKITDSREWVKHLGRTCVDIILYNQLEGGNTSREKHGRRADENNLCVCPEK